MRALAGPWLFYFSIERTVQSANDWNCAKRLICRTGIKRGPRILF
jgi:hypothetical protein